MSCHFCGSKTWTDDDFHWIWCLSPYCKNAYDDSKERYWEYNQELEEEESDREQFNVEV